jgi:hypothetical protein
MRFYGSLFGLAFRLPPPWRPLRVENSLRAYSGNVVQDTGRILMSMGPGGLFGAGDYFNPQGAYGPWAGCGCSSCFIILAGILLVMGGCLRMFGQ